MPRFNPNDLDPFSDLDLDLNADLYITVEDDFPLDEDEMTDEEIDTLLDGIEEDSDSTDNFYDADVGDSTDNFYDADGMEDSDDF